MTNIDDINIRDDVRPAKDLVTEEKLHEMLENAGKTRVIDDDLFAEIEQDERFNYRGNTMQKTICILLTDYADEGLTLEEFAYCIATFHNKPNYGIARAKADVTKFRSKRFACQIHDPDGTEAAEAEAETDAA